MTIFYLHGFNSDGGGYKCELLAAQFPQASILSPDLPADPAMVVAQLSALIAEAQAPVCFFGTSLGGFYAWYFGAITASPCFLFNPSLRPHKTLLRGVGEWTTWVKKRPYRFEAAYLNTLATLRTDALAVTQQPLLHFFLADDDEVLDHRATPDLFPQAGTMQRYAIAGHRFAPFAEALADIAARGVLLG